MRNSKHEAEPGWFLLAPRCVRCAAPGRQYHQIDHDQRRANHRNAERHIGQIARRRQRATTTIGWSPAIQVAGLTPAQWGCFGLLALGLYSWRLSRAGGQSVVG